MTDADNEPTCGAELAESTKAAPSRLKEQVAALQKRVAAIGPGDPEFDQKAFSDWMEDDR